jgi:hypothetical protein
LLIRAAIGDAFEALAGEELDPDTDAMVWNGLDNAHDEISFLIQELGTV